MAALLKADEDDDVLITEDELRRALTRSTATASGDDGITYPVSPTPESPRQPPGTAVQSLLP